MITQIKPENFNSTQKVAGVIISCVGKIALFKRVPHKKFGANKWALCAGGVEEGESFKVAAQRELFEETGVQVDIESLVDEKIFYHSDGPESGTEWHVFLCKLSELPVITLNGEHTEYTLVTKEESFLLDLMDGEKEVIQSFLI